MVFNLEKIASLLPSDDFGAETSVNEKEQCRNGLNSYHMLRSGLSSLLALTILTLPAHAVATSSSTESRIWQGWLQGGKERDQDRRF